MLGGMDACPLDGKMNECMGINKCSMKLLFFFDLNKKMQLKD